MSSAPPRRYRITLREIGPNGNARQIIDGTCSAYLLAITEDPDGELRVLTDHAGPASQRRKALESLIAHFSATIGLER